MVTPAYTVVQNQGETVIGLSLLDPFQAGQYLFASGDFVDFATNFPAAHLVLGNLCALKSAEVILFAHENDKTIAERFASQYHGDTRVVAIPQDRLLLLGQLIAIDPAGRASLYISGKAGFENCGTVEAPRIRTALLSFV